MKDNIYKSATGSIKPFEFNERVADVFPDMIKRSVPGYLQTIEMISAIAREYVVADSCIYDLGCSLGAASLSIRHAISSKHCQIIAVDNSPAMVSRLEKIVERDSSSIPIKVLEADIEDININNASLVILNFTLQFIRPERRQTLINEVYEGILPGGVAVISEKITSHDDEENRNMIALHEQFKKLNGYDELEVAAKRTALENVLIPDTLDQHHQRLYKAGFKQVTTWMQCFNFASMIAYKR